jgi:hypothetical protein
MTEFRCYISPSGDDEVSRWYLAQSPNVRGAIFAVVESLRNRPRHLWRRKPYGQLRGLSCLGLGEIRVEEPVGSHCRILGFFLDHTSVFVLLYGFAKDSDPSYDAACPEAQIRRSSVEQDHAQARFCQFPATGGAGQWAI